MSNQRRKVTYQFSEYIDGDDSTIKHDIERARAFHERFIRVKAHKSDIDVVVVEQEVIHDAGQPSLFDVESSNGRAMASD